MRKFRRLPFWHVIMVFLLGMVCGTQTALYLMDLYDDGIADPLSGFIALVMIAISLGYILFLFRKKRPDKNNNPGAGIR